MRNIFDISGKVCVITGGSGVLGGTIATYLLWKAITSDNINIGIAANVQKLATEVLDKIKKIYIEMPIWLQPGLMSWNKKGSEMSMNVIIIAAIALLVLVILAVLLLQKGGDLSESTSCEGLGGECLPAENCNLPSIPKPDAGCVKRMGEGYKCCIDLG